MKGNKYILLIGLHILIAIGVYVMPMLSKVYLVSILVFFSGKIYYSKKSIRSVQILIACGYIVGAEVFIRMTGGSLLYEASKYFVILFCLMGLLITGINKRSLPYFIYVFLLIPGILVATYSIGEQTVIRKAIAFNLSGPVCLGIVALFCYRLKVRYLDTHKILLALVLPLVTTMTYLFLYNPSIKEVITGTQSNFATSGGFGPNQVATVLGMGMFVLITRFFMKSPSILLKILNLSLLGLLAYRGIVTFSRGGIIVALIMIIAFVYYYYKKVNSGNKKRIVKYVFIIFGGAILLWGFTSIQTNGFIDKRYANQDALGREKEDMSTGRGALISFELNEFIENPVLGVGVGKIKKLREEKEGLHAASHNEMSRILSEHGMFGAFAFLILLIAPLVLRLKNKSNVFFYSCYLFWLLTINHSSMRIAAPAFIYGLCLLNVIYDTPKIKTRSKAYRTE